jgi:hypothetical protein
LVLLAVLIVLLVYMAPRNSIWNLAVLLAPSLFLVFRVGVFEWRRELDAPSRVEGAWALLALAAGSLLPLAACAAYYQQQGLLTALLFNTVYGLPALMDWWIPFPAADASYVLWTGVTLGAFGVTWASRRAAVGRSRLGRRGGGGRLVRALGRGSRIRSVALRGPRELVVLVQ